MKGDNTVDQTGTYGTLGSPHKNNKPGARNSSTTWRDTDGNLWLFGGIGYGATNSGFLNDLWKYNPVSNKWAWMKGDNSPGQYSAYGIKGTANPSNKPGGIFSSVSWTDSAGNLWLFGGYGYSKDAFGLLNTLWKYNPSTNEWTWIKGDSLIDKIGVYGTKGIANPINSPGARYGSQTWIDNSGNLWLYGGYGYDENSSGILNDIWKYNPSTNEWTWIKGDNTINQVGNYGTKGIATLTNNPGSRYVCSSWKDESGNIWIFGGYGYDEINEGPLNDIWKYNPSSNMWTWINGDNIINQTAIYGTPGIPNESNKPGARYVCSSWKDLSGDLWLFGGYGFDVSQSGYLNDLWKYNPATNKWTWVKGDNVVDQVAIYGTQGMADTSNKSGARTNSVSWTDGNGNLWLFGGNGFDGSTSGILNDLWKINSFGSLLPLHLIQFTGVLVNDVVHLQWQTEQESDFSHFIIQRSFDGVNFTNLSNIAGSGSNGLNNYEYTDTDLKNHSVTTVYYRLQLVNKDAQSTYSKILRFDLDKRSLSIRLFPNPAINSLNLSFEQERAGKAEVNIVDMIGSTVKAQSENIPAGRTSMNIDVHTLPPGTYLVLVTTANQILQQKFIKQ
jgi:hypothetical protein